MGAPFMRRAEKSMTFPATIVLITPWTGYIAAAGIVGDANGYLFRTTMRRSGILTEKPLH